jgi:transcriptional regulator with XRE-family HTH domain
MPKPAEYDRLLGNKISARREAMRYTLREVSLQLGYSPSALQKKEIGENCFSIGDLVILCSVLQVEITWFFSPDLLGGKSVYTPVPTIFSDSVAENHAEYLTEKTAQELLDAIGKLQKIYRF